MSHHNIDNTHIEDLLSRYVDGELSERERTELKRMAVNDEKFAERIVRAKKQKELLNNIPVESAPAGISDAVRLSLERKFLLNGMPESTNETAGARYLFSRRLMTAAIIFVLCGGLLYMVMQVFMKPAGLSGPPISTSRPASITAPEKKLPAETSPTTPVAQAHVFSASLDLTSKDAISMNAFISKAIFSEGLLNETFKNSNDGVTSYYVTTDITKLRALLNGLASGWNQCEQAKLTAYGILPGTDVVVENTTAAQVIAIFKQEEYLNRIEVARDFSDFNAVIGTSEDSEAYVLRDKGDNRDILLIPEFPGLTSGEKSSAGKIGEIGIEKVSLTITVKGI